MSRTQSSDPRGAMYLYWKKATASISPRVNVLFPPCLSSTLLRPLLVRHLTASSHNTLVGQEALHRVNTYPTQRALKLTRSDTSTSTVPHEVTVPEVGVSVLTEGFFGFHAAEVSLCPAESGSG